MATGARQIDRHMQAIMAIFKELREALSLTQVQVARAASIYPATVGKIERGVSAIDVGQLNRVAAAFGLLPDHFHLAARGEIDLPTLIGMAEASTAIMETRGTGHQG
jgi:transcriptional regulator with XRE-family HTH domain